MTSSTKQEDHPSLSELCTVVDAYYKAGFIDVTHADSLISYMSRNNMLTKQSLSLLTTSNALKLFRSLLTATQTYGESETNKLSKTNANQLIEAFGVYITSEASQKFKPGTWLAILDIVRRADGFPQDIENLMKNAYYTSMEE